MLSSLLKRHALERPEQPALVAEGRTLSWEELHGYVDRLATGLRDNGVERAVPVGLALDTSPAFVSAFLALTRIGAIAVPIGPDKQGVELTAALRISDCPILLAEDRHADACKDLLGSGVLQRAFLVNRDRDRAPSLARQGSDSVADPPASVPRGDDDAVWLFTSGTTGEPSLVARSHANLSSLASAFVATVGVRPSDRILTVIPLSHGYGLCSGLLAALHSGATLYLEKRFDRRQVLRLLSRGEITLFPAVPFMFSILADTPMPAPVELSSLRLCITGAAPLSRATWTKVRDKLGLSLRQSYGTSETGVITVNMDSDPEATVESVGRPLAGVEVAIWDETGGPVNEGSEGEIVVRSPAAATWVRTPKRDGSGLDGAPLADTRGWIHTGDLGRVDRDGRIFISGRLLSTINVAGRKVAHGEIEAVLESHPKILTAQVTALRDGHGEAAIRAQVVSSEPCSHAELIEYCRERLAAYKVPRLVEIHYNKRFPAADVDRK